jgi:hypothetical protein
MAGRFTWGQPKFVGSLAASCKNEGSSRKNGFPVRESPWMNMFECGGRRTPRAGFSPPNTCSMLS